MSQTTDILRAAMFIPLSGDDHGACTDPENIIWGLPMLMSGGSGIAKSAMTNQLSEMTKLPVSTFIGSVHEPTDLNGLPYVEDGETRFAVPHFLNKLIKEERGTLFLDELTTCAPAMQAGMLRLVLERTVGSLKLPGGVRIISAMNPPELAAGGWDISPPMANRFGHIDWDCPSAEDWGLHMMGASSSASWVTDATETEAAVLEAWSDAYARATGLVSGFLNKRPELRYQQPTADDPKGSKAWPSLRTWDFATRALAGSMIHGLDDDTTYAFMGSFVGASAITEFVAWKAAADLPDPADVLDGKTTFTHEPFRLDRTVAVLNSCAGMVAGDTEKARRAKRAQALWAIIADIADGAADIVAPAAEVLVKRCRLVSFPEARKALGTLQPVLSANR